MCFQRCHTHVVCAVFSQVLSDDVLPKDDAALAQELWPVHLRRCIQPRKRLENIAPWRRLPMDFEAITKWADCTIEYNEYRIPTGTHLIHKRQPLAPRCPWRETPLPLNVSIIVTGFIQTSLLSPVGDWNGYDTSILMKRTLHLRTPTPSDANNTRQLLHNV